MAFGRLPHELDAVTYADYQVMKAAVFGTDKRE